MTTSQAELRAGGRSPSAAPGFTVSAIAIGRRAGRRRQRTPGLARGGKRGGHQAVVRRRGLDPIAGLPVALEPARRRRHEALVAGQHLVAGDARRGRRGRRWPSKSIGIGHVETALGGGGKTMAARQRVLAAALGAATSRRSSSGEVSQPSGLPQPSIHGSAAGARAARRRSPPAVPSVMVPVLSSTTIVCRLCAVSSAAPSRIRTPFSAPLPVPTMIAVGVARPRAQGQAMTSTATTLSRA